MPYRRSPRMDASRNACRRIRRNDAFLFRLHVRGCALFRKRPGRDCRRRPEGVSFRRLDSRGRILRSGLSIARGERTLRMRAVGRARPFPGRKRQGLFPCAKKARQPDPRHAGFASRLFGSLHDARPVRTLPQASGPFLSKPRDRFRQGGAPAARRHFPGLPEPLQGESDRFRP